MLRFERKTKKKVSCAILATALVLAVVFVVALTQEPTSSSRTPSPRFNRAWEYDFSGGLQHRYSLEFNGGGETQHGDAKGASAVSLRADLFITNHGFANEAYSIEYSLGNITHAEIWSNHKDLLGGGQKAMAAFERGSIFLSVDHTGNVIERYTSQEMNPISGQIFELIVAELEVVVIEADSWNNVQGGILGFGPLKYTLVENSSENFTISRKRLHYDSLHALANYSPHNDTQIESQSTIKLNPHGFIQSFHGSEHVIAGERFDMDWSLTTRYIDSKRNIITNVGHLQESESLRKQGDQRNARAMAERQSLLARAGNLSPAAFRKGLLSSGTLGTLPNHNRWLWQSIALLQLFPELCLEFVDYLDHKPFNDEGKALLVDLLTNVGHQQAQEALREILQHPRMKQSQSYFDFVQRGVFLEKMNPTTIDFYQELQSGEHASSIQIAASIALGGAANSLQGSGQEEFALELGHEIAGKLNDSEDATNRSGYIAALGNAGLEAFTPQLLKETRHDSASVRISAISALSYSDSPEVRARLQSLFTDEKAAVRNQSLKVFSQKSMRSDEIYHLIDLVNEERLNAGEFYRLLQIASRLKEEGKDYAIDLVAAIRARQPKQAAVRQLLSRLR